MKAIDRFKLCGYGKYFELNINQRINERQQRNGLNINHLFYCTITQGSYTGYTATYPKINNGLYHHIGKNHSQYPKHNSEERN